MHEPLPFVSGPIEIIGCHAAGEVGDVIVSGVEPPPGDTIWAQRCWIDADQRLRNHVLNEPRGGVFKHVNLLVPAVDPRADIGFIIMEPMHSPPMSGSNSICVATVVLETGIVAMTEPTTTLVLEAPGGLVEVTASCSNGKVQQVTVRNVAAFVAERDVALDVPGIGTLRVDTAFGGDSFVMVDAGDIGIEITPDNARSVAEITTHKSQERLVTPTAKSFGDALFPEVIDGAPVVPWLRAIEADNELVGFVMVALRTAHHPNPYLWRLLIGRMHQRRGIGNRALDLLEQICRDTGATAIEVSWEEGRGSPAPFYEARGYVRTGRIVDGETEAIKTLL